MTRVEAIERLKQGDELIYDNGPKYAEAHFRSDGERLRLDTAFKLKYSGLVNIKKSPTAHGVEYLTWKE